MARRDLILTYSPKLYRLAKKEEHQSIYVRPTMELASMASLWAALVMAGIRVATLALLLSGLLITAASLVELSFWLKVLWRAW